MKKPKDNRQDSVQYTIFLNNMINFPVLNFLAVYAK